jgi:uroporphyrin-III C-methyltransferase
VAVVQNATRADQREAVTTLGSLQDTIEREGLGSPAVIVVGDVVRGVAAMADAPRRAAAG